MVSRRLILYTFSCAALLVAALFSVKSAQAATMQFEPVTGSYTTNTVFQVKVNVNTSGVDTTSADAVVKYDSTLLGVDTVSYGSFYPTVLHSVQSNKLYISGMVSNPGSVINGTGTLATINFRALAPGSATISFDCTSGKTDDSNVTKNDTNATDILDCSTLSYASFTITGTAISVTPAPITGSPSVTAAPTITSGGPTLTPVPVVTRIPSAGITDVVSLFPRLLMGLMFLAIGLVPLLI